MGRVVSWKSFIQDVDGELYSLNFDLKRLILLLAPNPNWTLHPKPYETLKASPLSFKVASARLYVSGSNCADNT